jgi:mono/diheme cytochrome c family protein
MRRFVLPIGLVLLVATISGVPAASADPIFVDQGPRWTSATRADFYTRDEGSRLINFSWLQALNGRDGRPFLADSMSRYGFLPNPDNTAGLPVGFHTSGPAGFQIVGVTCSACHTRQLEVDGKMYRVDGGPALTDFQAFLGDLDQAVADATADDAAFASFAAAVLKPATPTSADVAALRKTVDAWFKRFHAFTKGTLPPPPGWGLGRLDAIGIIFNRISGLDVGPPPDLLIPDNMKVGDAPVRYPFLWNAPLQDKTEWAGFVSNGNDLFALSRNTGQALAFGNFEPKHLIGPFFDYLTNNSINFDGLEKIEGLLRQIGPPKWPEQFPLNRALAADGQKVFDRECGKCHGIKEVPSVLGVTWSTPVQNVGTDTRQYDDHELGRKVKSGALTGAGIPGVAAPLKDEDFAVSMMFTAVAGSITQHLLAGGFLGDAGSPFGGGFGNALTPSFTPGSSAAPLSLPPLPPALQELAKAYRVPNSLQPAAPPAQPTAQPTTLPIEGGTLFANTLVRGAYEARVLQGIWAAAPYLHNGSVPTLAELLKPSAQRVSQFNLGAKYDIDNVGLAATQNTSIPPRTLTGCDDLDSGNSRCGHEFGTGLSDQDKKALLEYLKTL